MGKEAFVLKSLSDRLLVDILISGQAAVIPTDTVYGLAARADDKTAVNILYGLKNRREKPGTVIAASINQLVELGIKKRYLSALSDFWPGKISIEVPHSISYLNQNTGRQAFRIVAEKDLIRLLELTGPLLTSSCNQPGKPPARNINEAKKYFGDSIRAYVDGGDLSGRLPSTLIRIVDDAIEVIREGAVKIDESGRITSE